MSRRAAGRGDGRSSVWRADLSTLRGRRRDLTDDSAPVRAPFIPTLPSVNVLPASVRAAITVRRLIRRFALGALLIIAISAGVWYLQSDQIDQAQRAVADATATNTKVRDDLASLTPVRTMYEQITRLQGVVTGTLAAQPQAQFVIEQILAAGTEAAGGDADFASIDVVYNGIPMPGDALNPCPNPDPFGTEIAIGCVTFNASMASREQVADLLRALESNPLFVGPYVTTSTVSSVEGEPDSVAFTGSAGISTEGLVTPLSEEEIASITSPPPAEGTESASDEADTDPSATADEPTSEGAAR